MTISDGMSNTEHLLCIGGPRDGEKIAVDRHAPYVRVAIALGHRVTLWSEPSASIKIEYFIYERAIWRHGRTGDTTSLLVPQGQDDAETMRVLLDKYKPERRAKV